MVRISDLGTSDGHLRILFLNWRDIANPEAGGAEVFTHEVAKRWVEQGHEVSLLTSRFPECSRTETINGVKIRRIGLLPNVIREPSTDVPETYVFRQDPPPGTKENKGAQVTIKFSDARKGTIVLDVTDGEAELMGAKGRRQARRGRRPKARA